MGRIYVNKTENFTVRNGMSSYVFYVSKTEKKGTQYSMITCKVVTFQFRNPKLHMIFMVFHRRFSSFFNSKFNRSSSGRF